jgi:hypothetical protein
MSQDMVYKFRIVSDGGVARLECTRDTGMILMFL